jgi:hypothetical protein
VLDGWLLAPTSKGYLSTGLLVGLGANALLGWRWADLITAPTFAGAARCEGREAGVETLAARLTDLMPGYRRSRQRLTATPAQITSTTPNGHAPARKP